MALLDVDHTTLFGTVGFDDATLQLNTNMLGALRDFGVTDVYFFTDMTLSTSSVAERRALGAILRERYGFTVHGTLTPCDLAWRGFGADEALRLHGLCFEEGAYAGKFYGPAFAGFVASRASELPRLHAALAHYDPRSNAAGAAFDDAVADMALSAAGSCDDAEAGSSEGTVARGTVVRSVFAKAIGDQLAVELGYEHSKGLLLDLFLRTTAPAWVGSVVVCDDDAAVADSIEVFRPVPAERLESSRAAASPPLLTVTMLRVTGEGMPREAYDRCLSGHFRRVHATGWSLAAVRFSRCKVGSTDATEGLLVAALPPCACPPDDCLFSLPVASERAAAAVFADNPSSGLPRLLEAAGAAGDDDAGGGAGVGAMKAHRLRRFSCFWEVTPKPSGVAGALAVRVEVAPREGIQLDELAALVLAACRDVARDAANGEGTHLKGGASGTGPNRGGAVAWRDAPFRASIPAPDPHRPACALS